MRGPAVDAAVLALAADIVRERADKLVEEDAPGSYTRDVERRVERSNLRDVAATLDRLSRGGS